jgi:hypothetical protein
MLGATSKKYTGKNSSHKTEIPRQTVDHATLIFPALPVTLYPQHMMTIKLNIDNTTAQKLDRKMPSHW